MFDINHRIIAFNKLGFWIKSFIDNSSPESEEFIDLNIAINKAIAVNKWFTKDHIFYALSEWENLLTKEGLEQWISPYNNDFKATNQTTVGIIMAGNLPLVGFHDFLSVLMSGLNADVKLSSDDNVLIPAIAAKLFEIEPRFKEMLTFSERLKNIDAIIATGSNNTARYFESYFGHKPNIIRKSRNSIAILTGKESNDELELLADDLFLYFGLGCRNVTKLFLPEGFNLDRLFKSFMKYKSVMDHNKYMNNFDYYRAIYLLNLEPFLENGFAILKEEKRFSTPVSVIHYSYYKSLDEVNSEIKNNENQIQCIVADSKTRVNSVSFGQSQKPSLTEYADNVNTLEFLKELV